MIENHLSTQIGSSQRLSRLVYVLIVHSLGEAREQKNSILVVVKDCSINSYTWCVTRQNEKEQCTMQKGKRT